MGFKCIYYNDIVFGFMNIEEVLILCVMKDSQSTLIITGKLLLKMGYTPGPQMGQIIQKAYEIQLEKDWNQEQLTDFITKQYNVS